jgi:predicted glycosyltransferase involved in capsule biosynthesis
MKMLRRTGETQVYHLFHSLLNLVKVMKSRAKNNQVEFSPNANSNIVGVRVDPQSRAEALQMGDQHQYTGSIVTGMYHAAHQATAEQIAEAQVARQFGYHRRFFTAKLVDVFTSKNGSLCISLGGVVTRRNQKDPTKKMYRTFNLDDGSLKSVAVELFEAGIKPSAVKAYTKKLAKIKAKKSKAKVKTVKVKP